MVSTWRFGKGGWGAHRACSLMFLDPGKQQKVLQTCTSHTL